MGRQPQGSPCVGRLLQGASDYRKTVIRFIGWGELFKGWPDVRRLSEGSSSMKRLSQGSSGMGRQSQGWESYHQVHGEVTEGCYKVHKCGKLVTKFIYIFKGFKYSYLILMILWNINHLFALLNGFKYFYPTSVVLFIKYSNVIQIICTQLYSFK